MQWDTCVSFGFFFVVCMPLILFANVNWYIRYRKVCWFGVILLSKKMCRAQLLLYVMYTQYMKGPGLQDNCLQWSRSHGSWKGFLCCVLCDWSIPKEGILSSRLPDWGGDPWKSLSVWERLLQFATTAVHAKACPQDGGQSVLEPIRPLRITWKEWLRWVYLKSTGSSLPLYKSRFWTPIFAGLSSQIHVSSSF